MVAGEVFVPEALATVVAYQRLSLTRLKLIDLSLRLVLVLVIIRGFACLSSLDILQRLVLVVLQPLQGTLDFEIVSNRLDTLMGTTYGRHFS